MTIYFSFVRKLVRFRRVVDVNSGGVHTKGHSIWIAEYLNVENAVTRWEIACIEWKTPSDLQGSCVPKIYGVAFGRRTAPPPKQVDRAKAEPPDDADRGESP